jgi:hypothetical protein
MKISRRYFLGRAVASGATLWSFRPTGFDAPGFPPERGLDCALFDVNAHCALRESLRGYQAALGDKYRRSLETGLDSKRLCRIAIFPGLGSIDLAMAETLSGLLAQRNLPPIRKCSIVISKLRLPPLWTYGRNSLPRTPSFRVAHGHTRVRRIWTVSNPFLTLAILGHARRRSGISAGPFLC